MRPGRVVIGLALVGLGVLFLLDQAGTVDAGREISRWWPAVIVALGLVQLLDRPRSVLGPLIVAGAGGILLLFSTDVLEGSAWNVVWPVVLIVVGASILLRRGAGRAPEGTGDQVVRSSAIFGGNEVANLSSRFRGGSLTAVFGGVTLDLRRATPAEEGATVSATAVLGGVDIVVPEDWSVTLSGTPILGGFEDQRRPVGPPPPDAPHLTVDGLAILGGLTVKSSP